MGRLSLGSCRPPSVVTVLVRRHRGWGGGRAEPWRVPVQAKPGGARPPSDPAVGHVLLSASLPTVTVLIQTVMFERSQHQAFL